MTVDNRHRPTSAVESKLIHAYIESDLSGWSHRVSVHPVGDDGLFSVVILRPESHEANTEPDFDTALSMTWGELTADKPIVDLITGHAWVEQRGTSDSYGEDLPVLAVCWQFGTDGNWMGSPYIPSWRREDLIRQGFIAQ